MRVAVSGGAGGLGRALARGLVDRGHSVFVIDSVFSEISGISGFLVADLSREESEEEISRFFADQPIDVLICNAGIFKFGNLLEISTSEILRNFQVNVFGAIRCVRGCQPLRKIFFISSEGAGLPFSRSTWPYLGTKRLLEDYARTLRLETSLSVTVVRPGAMSTGMLAGVEKSAIGKLTSELARYWVSSAEEVAARVIDALELRDSPEELNVGHNPILWLAKWLPARLVLWAQGIILDKL